MTKIVDKKTLLNAVDMQWNELLPEIKKSFLKEQNFSIHTFIFKACDSIEKDSEFDKKAFVNNSHLKNRSNFMMGTGAINSVVGSYVHSCVDRIFFDNFNDIRDELIDSPEYWRNAHK